VEDEERAAQVAILSTKVLGAQVLEELALMVNGRPARVTCASPALSIVGTAAWKLATTCSASEGAPIVTTA
jgi:hypothetical protein